MFLFMGGLKLTLNIATMGNLMTHIHLLLAYICCVYFLSPDVVITYIFFNFNCYLTFRPVLVIILHDFFGLYFHCDI